MSQTYDNDAGPSAVGPAFDPADDWRGMSPHSLDPSGMDAAVGNKRLGVAAAAWGLATAFSHISGEARASLVQAAGLLAASAILSTITWRWLVAWCRATAGLLIAAHAAVAVLSGVINESHPLFVTRYLLLVPALSMMLFAARRGDRAVNAVRGGLTFSGACFVLFHLGAADLSRLSDPTYRLSLYLNPNGVAFIAGMTAVSLFDYGLRRLGSARGKISLAAMLWFACVVACLVLCVATKSRTAMLATMTGLAVRLYLSLGLARTLLLSLAAAALALGVAWGLLESAAESISTTFQLNDRLRGIGTGTGRFRAWETMANEVWLPNALLGAGPGRDIQLAPVYAGVSSSHNGVLASLVEVGITGTAPLLVVVAVATAGALRALRRPPLAFAAAIFAAGLVESLAETMFFSMGNPGSQLFLLSVAVLTTATTNRGVEPNAGSPEPAEPYGRS